MAAHSCFAPSNHYHNRFPLPCRSGRGSTSLSPPIAAPSFVPRSHPPAGFWHCRMRGKLRAFSSSGESSSAPVISGKSPLQSSPVVRLTYLEGNSWLWDVGGLNILVDPVLVGNLDFGIPWLYDAAKKALKKLRLEDLPEVDFLLITQSLDDHCHVNTLKPLSKMHPDLWVIATPNAESILSPLFRNVMYLEPGQSSELEGRYGAKLTIRATDGPVLGPPWQRPENGYIITFGESYDILYYEPHCVYNQSLVQNYQADIIITPVIKQMLPFFTLVSGQEDAVNLAKLLRAKFIVPMQNGDLDAKGILTNILKTEGTVESFKGSKNQLKQTIPAPLMVQKLKKEEIRRDRCGKQTIIRPAIGKKKDPAAVANSTSVVIFLAGPSAAIFSCTDPSSAAPCEIDQGVVPAQQPYCRSPYSPAQQASQPVADKDPLSHPSLL